LFNTTAFDLVFTDLGMPEMSGLEVAATVKEQSPTTAVVMITGWGMEMDEKRLREEGVDLLLCKPFDLVTVQNSVVAALKPEERIEWT
jgi:DNA-binding response OmpR family regulator